MFVVVFILGKLGCDNYSFNWIRTHPLNWELRMEVLEADFFTLFLKLDNLDTNN